MQRSRRRRLDVTAPHQPPLNVARTQVVGELLAAAGPAGDAAPRVLVNCATILPATVARLAAKAAEQGVQLLNMPVFGGWVGGWCKGRAASVAVAALDLQISQDAHSRSVCVVSSAGRPDAAAAGSLVAVPAGPAVARELLAPLLPAFAGGRQRGKGEGQAWRWLGDRSRPCFPHPPLVCCMLLFPVTPPLACRPRCVGPWRGPLCFCGSQAGGQLLDCEPD